VVIRDTIPSRALEIWRRLYTRFSLEPGPASVVPDVSKTIWPVTSVDPMLRRSRGNNPTLDLSVSAGSFVAAATVPDGQAWYLTTIGLRSTVGSTAAAMRISGVIVALSDLGTPASFHTLRHRLEAGDIIGAVAGGNAGDDTRVFQASWEEEDV